MDIMTILGLIIGIGAVFGGYVGEGGDPVWVLLHPFAWIIVFGGALGCGLIGLPMAHGKHVLKTTPKLFMPPKLNPGEMIDKMVDWAQIARREGLLGLEGVSETEDNPFARKGLRMLVDGREPEAIRKILEIELETVETLDVAASKFYGELGGYAPTIGIIGAVLALIVVMGDLSDPNAVGKGIATAFCATVYALLLANLIFLPWGNKLKIIAQEEAQFRFMIVEGLVLIASGENPRNLEDQLRSYAT
ncbi:flagellar motor protein [Pseudomonadales bacterium]|jgi:chemotaxis protein MotA|nr:flagellar motor protein [Pseudomonadales bacterium]MDC3304759.1 flagellar motor protein [bacterium]